MFGKRILSYLKDSSSSTYSTPESLRNDPLEGLKVYPHVALEGQPDMLTETERLAIVFGHYLTGGTVDAPQATTVQHNQSE